MLYTEKIAQEIREKLLDVSIKIEEDEEWAFDVVASTEDQDRDGETVKVNGWDTTNWLKNPVVLANHTYKIENIVGKWVEFYTSNWQKRLKGYFSKSNPLGVLAKQLYQEGMLKAVSVGFIVLKRNETDYRIIEKAELLEVSFVAVPCNPNAISMDGKLFDEAVQKWLLIKEVEEEKEAVPTLEEKVDNIEKNINSIMNLVKGLADDKAETNDIEKQELEAKAKKEFLQNINKATAIALENLKKL